MLSSPHNIKYHVTQVTTDVKVDTYPLLGSSYKKLVSHLMSVSHTHLDQVELKNAQRNVLMALNLNNTEPRMSRPTTQLKMLNLISSQTVQLKQVSSFTKISCLTDQVSTDIHQDNNSVVMPLKLPVGVLKRVLIIGLLLTHGELHGVKKVSSESKKVNAVSKNN
jgi:hypothetical protein